jgi:nucleoside-diphosphate-sugar epimerase
MRILVTGASGKAGKWVVRDLVDHGHDVVATDIAPALPDCPAPFLRADLTDYGQAVAVLDGFEAVAHLANIPAPELFTPAHTLNTNNAMNSNVFLAAADRRLQRVVWASSETTLGLPFDEPPRYAPVDEEHFPVPTTTYALSKVVAETMAEQVSSWSGIPFAALRLSNVIDPSDETVMDRPSAELLREVFPGVELTREVDTHQTLLANDRAKSLFGWAPAHSWHDELGRA